MISHDKLLFLLQTLGYPINSDGMCYGLSMMAMQAILGGDTEQFLSMLESLNDLSEDELEQEIEQLENTRKEYIEKIKLTLQKEIKEKGDIKIDEGKSFEDQLNLEQKDTYYQNLNLRIKKIEETKFSEQQRNILSIRAFFDGIALYFDPGMFPHLFKKPNISQEDTELIFPLILPDKLLVKKEAKEDKNEITYTPNIEKVKHYSAPYDREKLLFCFELLDKTFIKNELKYPVSFVLGSGDHAITVAWIPKKGWQFIDANNLLLAAELMDNSQIAQQVLEAFSENDTAVFTTDVFSHKNSSADVSRCLEECFKNENWNKIHDVSQVNSEMINAMDSSQTSWIYLAARVGDNKKIQQLIEKKANIDQKLDTGETALWIACQNGHLETVRLLLENGANPNIARDEDGFTPLLVAAQRGYTGIMNLLILHGAKVDQAGNKGITPIYAACERGHLESARLLLERKADVNKLCNKIPPLQIATQIGNTQIVSLLLENGARLDNQNGSNFLRLIARKGHIDILNLFLDKKINPSLNFSTMKKFLLEEAKNKGREKLVGEFFQKRNITGSEIKNVNALHLAAFYGHTDMVTTLLDRGVNPDDLCEQKISASELAQIMGHTSIVETLKSYKKPQAEGAEAAEAAQAGAAAAAAKDKQQPSAHIKLSILTKSPSSEAPRTPASSVTPISSPSSEQEISSSVASSPASTPGKINSVG